MTANEKRAYKAHVVLRLTLNFLRLALRFVRAPSIDKRMGAHEAPCSAVPRSEALCFELRRKR